MIQGQVFFPLSLASRLVPRMDLERAEVSEWVAVAVVAVTVAEDLPRNGVHNEVVAQVEESVAVEQCVMLWAFRS